MVVSAVTAKRMYQKKRPLTGMMKDSDHEKAGSIAIRKKEDQFGEDDSIQNRFEYVPRQTIAWEYVYSIREGNLLLFRHIRYVI